jgi:hypothetical protein
MYNAAITRIGTFYGKQIMLKHIKVFYDSLIINDICHL